MGHTDEVATILRPGIRTFKPRRSRITPRQLRALRNAQTSNHSLVSLGTLDSVWASARPVVLDIGFGAGQPVVELARTFPEFTILAIDVHTPGIGDLLDLITTENIEHVFVMEGDALEVLAELPGPLGGIRSFFPDPWPKARHHKRRLLQPAVIAATARVVAPGGFWHVATDWMEYAESICAAFDADATWSGGVIERPPWRPVTHFERRAIREGRPIVDMWFQRK